jgi:hypothetical protein
MSEVEFDLILDAVRTAIAPAPQEDFLAHPQTSAASPRAANDNQLAWPLLPFPDSWYAAV